MLCKFEVWLQLLRHLKNICFCLNKRCHTRKFSFRSVSFNICKRYPQSNKILSVTVIKCLKTRLYYYWFRKSHNLLGLTLTNIVLPHRTWLFREVGVSPLCEPPGGHSGVYGGLVPRLGRALRVLVEAIGGGDFLRPALVQGGPEVWKAITSFSDASVFHTCLKELPALTERARHQVNCLPGSRDLFKRNTAHPVATWAT